MNKQQVYDFLKNNNIDFEVTEHPAMFSMEDTCEVELPYPDADAKNLFVRDDKKRNYYLITVRGAKRVDLKEFGTEHRTRRLSFASAEDLKKYLGVEPGSVSPLGLLNDEERKVKFFLDSEFKDVTGRIGIHPNDNTATVWLKTDDLIKIIKDHGNETELW